MKNSTLWQALFSFLVAIAMTACAGADPTAPTDERPVDENGKATFSATGAEELAPSKDDSLTGRRGLPVSVDSASTAVWEVQNRWDDTDTPAAREAGIAWGENSGLNWDEKYSRWVAQMEKVDGVDSFFGNQTFMLTTPWGKQLPAPALECAEAAIFLRITFASWYNLPFFLEAADGHGRIYFGHFGMRRAEGKFGSMPNFRDRYPDFSDRAASVRAGGDWPSDSDLRGKTIPGSFDDEQPMLGENAHAGAYFDEIYLNKRVGHFMILTLAWFGSVNVADSANTFNLRPEAVSAGDVLVERWQKVGIGHTLIVMRSNDAGTTELDGEVIPQLEVELASGSMPRRQPDWESPGASKRYFSLNATGGEGTEAFGGGLKRWRVAKNVGGTWTNVVMPNYADDWVNSRDHAAIAARLDRFRQILVELSPEQKRDVLLDIIEGKRQHLRRFPASCAARIAREEAFESLYELMGSEFGTSASEVDAQFRTLEDYVFAELEYEKSKTCCWNQSTNGMYEIIMDLNISQQQGSEACMAPVVFMNRDDAGDGYDLFRQHAAALGREGEWNRWSEDESCPQRNVPQDTVAESHAADYCALPTDGGPVDPQPSGDVVTATFDGGAIPDNDPAGLTVTATATSAGEISSAVLNVDITHTWIGDIVIDVVHPDGTVSRVRNSEGSSDDDLHATLEVPGFAGKAAGGAYTLIVRDTASQDIGTLDSASLELRVQE